MSYVVAHQIICQKLTWVLVWLATASLGMCQLHLPCLVVLLLFWHMRSGAAATERICLLHVLCVSVVLVGSGPGAARTILLFHIISARPSK